MKRKSKKTQTDPCKSMQSKEVPQPHVPQKPIEANSEGSKKMLIPLDKCPKMEDNLENTPTNRRSSNREKKVPEPYFSDGVVFATSKRIYNMLTSSNYKQRRTKKNLKGKMKKSKGIPNDSAKGVSTKSHEN